MRAASVPYGGAFGVKSRRLRVPASVWVRGARRSSVERAAARPWAGAPRVLAASVTGGEWDDCRCRAAVPGRTRDAACGSTASVTGGAVDTSRGVDADGAGAGPGGAACRAIVGAGAAEAGGPDVPLARVVAATMDWRYLPTAVPIAPAMSCVTLAWPTVLSRSVYAKRPKIAANATKLSAAFVSRTPGRVSAGGRTSRRVVLHESFEAPRFDALRWMTRSGWGQAAFTIATAW